MKTILVQDSSGNVMDWTVVNDDAPQWQIDALAEQAARCGLVVTIQGEPPTLQDLVEAYRQEGDQIERFGGPREEPED